MGQILRKLTDFLTLNFFYPISEKNTPKWIIKASNKFYSKCRIRPYNKIIFLKGKHHIYKVWFEMIGQGQVKEHYYQKRKNNN